MKSIEDIEECGYDFDTLCQVIDNQKSNDETPAVGPAFDRLVKSGLGKKKVYRYIAGVLSTEIILGEDVGHFNYGRYELRLNALPDEFDESAYVEPKELSFGGVITSVYNPDGGKLSYWELKGLKPGPTGIIVSKEKREEFSLDPEGYIEGICKKRVVSFDGETEESWCLESISKFDPDYSKYLNRDPDDFDDN
ncbi:hypothetical protein R50072_12150 [Simiduia litorea]|uniref:hypothetical protein n=1 Tax=Simiduia litorea TaxID=1435348 RepID=UPI0036F1F8D7